MIATKVMIKKFICCMNLGYRIQYTKYFTNALLKILVDPRLPKDSRILLKIPITNSKARRL